MSSWTTLLYHGECWDRQPEWSPAIASEKSAFFTLNADHVTNAIKTRRHDSDHGEGKLSGPYQALPSWEVETSPLPPQFQEERYRATLFL